MNTANRRKLYPGKEQIVQGAPPSQHKIKYRVKSGRSEDIGSCSFVTDFSQIPKGALETLSGIWVAKTTPKHT